MEIKSLGWVNVDRFFKNPNKAEIRCEFDSLVNIQSAAIYVVFKNLNSMLKEYVNTGKEAKPVMLLNEYPAGEQVKIIAVTNIDGKFYQAKQELILRNKELVRFRFSPVTDMDVVKESFRF